MFSNAQNILRLFEEIDLLVPSSMTGCRSFVLYVRQWVFLKFRPVKAHNSRKQEHFVS